ERGPRYWRHEQRLDGNGLSLQSGAWGLRVTRLAGYATDLHHHFRDLGRGDSRFSSIALHSNVEDVEPGAKDCLGTSVERLRPRADSFARLLHRRQNRSADAARAQRVSKRAEAGYASAADADPRRHCID